MSKVDVKIVLLGKHSVGKTCLVERFLHGKFKDNTVATVGAAFGAKKMTVGNPPKEITLGIWDTAGQERYESMSRIYYRSAKAAIICYGINTCPLNLTCLDITDKKSFEKVQFWVDELTSNEEGCSIFIVGTKLDLVEEGTPRGVTSDETKKFASQHNARSYETSAKSGTGIEELFDDIAATYLAKDSMPSPSSSTVKPSSKDDDKKKSGGCCS